MATQGQIEASRRNAKRSTGPRTAQAKAASSRNALKFGIEPNDLLPPVDPTELQNFIDRYRSDPTLATVADDTIRNYATVKYHLKSTHRALYPLYEQAARDLYNALPKVTVILNVAHHYRVDEHRLRSQLFRKTPVKRIFAQIARTNQSRP